MAPRRLTVPTMPMNSDAGVTNDGVSDAAVNALVAKNQKRAEPIQVHWNPVFHLAGPIAAITVPRRRAAWRNIVMAISRPSTIATTQNGSGTGPIGVRNGSAVRPRKPALAVYEPRTSC